MGQWKDDARNGFGIEKNSKGETFKGTFKVKFVFASVTMSSMSNFILSYNYIDGPDYLSPEKRNHYIKLT